MEQQQAPQDIIEQKMQQIVNFGNYEAAYLFSREGLYIAKADNQKEVNPDRLAEISMLFNDVKKLASTLGGIEKLKEVFLEGTNRRKVIFRFFRAFEEEVVLAAVIPARKAYRKHTNDLQRLILSIDI